MTGEATIFFRKIFVFTLPLLLFFGLLELRLQGVANTYNMKRKNLESCLDSVEVLVVGSSHGLNGVNPKYLRARTYNLANTSQTLYYDEALVLKYADRMPKLRVIVMPISYFSFFGNLEDIEEEWRTYYYDYFWGIGCDYTENRFDLRKRSLTALYTPLTTLKYTVKGFRTHEVDSLERSGYMRKDTSAYYGTINDSTGLAKVRQHESERRLGRRGKIVGRLDAFLNVMRKKGIEVVFITTPVWRTYSKFLDQRILADNAGILAGLERKYGYRYFDYGNDRRFGLSDFANNDHLNDRGARKFSRILDAEVINHTGK